MLFVFSFDFSACFISSLGPVNVLIVLIITVIVLLILAGITIATLTGENGILTKAKEASKQTEIEGIREKAEIAKQGVLTQDLVSGIKTTRKDIIDAIVNEMGGTASENLITTEDGKEDKSIINSYAGKNAGNVVVTEGVKEIGAYAFIYWIYYGKKCAESKSSL